MSYTESPTGNNSCSVQCRGLVLGGKQGLSSHTEHGKIITWCLVPTVPAAPGDKRLAGKIAYSDFMEYGLGFGRINKSQL